MIEVVILFVKIEVEVMMTNIIRCYNVKFHYVLTMQDMFNQLEFVGNSFSHVFFFLIEFHCPAKAPET